MSDRVRVLIVDDDPAVTGFLERRLSSLPRYEVRSTNRPEVALSVAREFKPDAVVCDVDMGDYGGGEVLQAFRALPATAGVPFLFLSALVTPDDADRQGEVAGLPMMPKRGLKIEELVERLEALL